MLGHVLITGASIAGNAAAWWLTHHGVQVTVVERAHEFRDGGQNVDVRGIGRTVLKLMGLEQAALDGGTKEEGVAWIDARGRTIARIAMTDAGPNGPTAELEILRGDLSRLLYEPARTRASYRFGDHVTAIEDGEGAATVTFASGMIERFDAAVVAEGVGSSTREMVFPGENEPRWMDVTVALGTIPRTDEDDRFWRLYNAPGARSVGLRPDPYGTTRAGLILRRKAQGEHTWSVEEQKAYVRTQFADAGWQTPRILDGLDGTDDFYLDALRQVRMKRWSKGRVVLVGDAAWCVTPIGGIGSTLAITGGYVLASEMLRAASLPAAFAAYEQAMRPMVTDGQKVHGIGPRMLIPHSKVGIGLLHRALRVVTRPAIMKGLGKAFGGKPIEPDLSLYALTT